jgi:hypothetical protein
MMRKPHFEEELLRIPALATIRYHAPPDLEVGVLGRLSGLKKYLKQYQIKTADGKMEYSSEVFAYWAMFKAENCQIFKMAREFSEELAKVDLDIKTSYIPLSKKMVCIEFPEHMRFDLGGNRYARCVYAYVTNEKSTTSEGICAERYFEMFFPLYDENDKLTWEVHQFGLPIENLEQTFAEALELCKQRELNSPKIKELLAVPGNSYIWNTDLFSFILKSYLYICSGDPDLREYRAPKPPETGKVKKLRLWFRHHENQSLVDMVLVGFNFKKPTVYSVDRTSVVGHFRWQPCGPQRAQVKLIWIEAHERTFKTSQEGTPPT